MAEIIKIKKGLDIRLYGEVLQRCIVNIESKQYGVTISDFPGYMWKLDVKVGDTVKIGTPLLHDKSSSRINITSPISGCVRNIIRGERRKIEMVVIEKDGPDEYVNFDRPSDRETTIDLLCRSGLWTMIRQRPFDVIPNPEVIPRDIFVTAFDSSPLATELLSADELPMLDEGLKVLSTLTDGKVYLGVKFGSGISSSNAIVTEYVGPHPAGNVGVQIAAIKPVNKGEIVWCVDARTVVRIGVLFATGRLDTKTIVALTGELVGNPCLLSTYMGVSIESLVSGRLKNNSPKARVISGNVLTGSKVNTEDDFLRFPYRQITVIPEGDDADEFMGWASINPNKYSVKHWFPAFLRGLSRRFHFDARLKGGRRAMIVSGEYDKVFPMDIYPEYLLKAILAYDIDKMEQLGIYEVAPEDFALAEFVDTSKIELQQIVRAGLDKLREELK